MTKIDLNITGPADENDPNDPMVILMHNQVALAKGLEALSKDHMAMLHNQGQIVKGLNFIAKYLGLVYDQTPQGQWEIAQREAKNDPSNGFDTPSAA